MKLKKPIIVGFGDDKKEIKEIKITEDDFTAKILLEAEREFLISGGVFEKGNMEDSRAYLGIIVAKIIDCTPDDLEQLSGLEYVRATNIIKGFFGNLEYTELMEILSEK